MKNTTDIIFKIYVGIGVTLGLTCSAMAGPLLVIPYTKSMWQQYLAWPVTYLHIVWLDQLWDQFDAPKNKKE